MTNLQFITHSKGAMINVCDCLLLSKQLRLFLSLPLFIIAFIIVVIVIVYFVLDFCFLVNLL